MWLRIFSIIFIGISFFSFENIQEDMKAYAHVQDLKKGVLLVRLHTQDALIEKMKFYHQDVARKKKIEEIYANNKASYMALSHGYNFSEIRFFFGRESAKVKGGQYENVFLDSSLSIDNSITVPLDVPIYILDVGDIYFPHMSGHQEGMILLDAQFNPLEKPFPYYVRKRSGMAIIKRTDLEMGILLNDRLEAYFKESLKPRPDH